MSKYEGFNMLLIERSSVTNLKRLRTFLTEKDEEVFEQEKIVSLEDISPLVKEEVIKITDVLQNYIYDSFKGLVVDYYNDIRGESHFLSTLFALVSNWNLEQGRMKVKEDGKTYYHSWVSMGEIVYDPELRIVTRKDKYYTLFEMEEIYERDEIQELFKKTGTFTYYKRDLEDGCIFPTGYELLYNTKEAEVIATKIIEDLEEYEIQIAPRKNLDGKKYICGDIDATSAIKSKANYMANVISKKEGISYYEAYRKFINSRFFHDIEKIENGLWIEPYETIERLYQEQQPKEKIKK